VVSQHAPKAMSLVVAYYVEWAFAVVEAFNRRLTGDDDASARAKRLRDAALHCPRNGRSDDTVGRPYREGLSGLRSRVPLGGVAVKRRMVALCTRLDKRLQAALGADTHVRF
jgi:hypothetical protein